jgi:hypothetical protein
MARKGGTNHRVTGATEKRFTTDPADGGTHPPASPERLAMAGRRICTEKILVRITKTRKNIELAADEYQLEVGGALRSRLEAKDSIFP